ncbi:MAG: hypothetical protein KGI80_00740 [Verrucomicrobiota bacterium]|nr:hypothetical protein [Verrucomicrobiota bacterium]
MKKLLALPLLLFAALPEPPKPSFPEQQEADGLRIEATFLYWQCIEDGLEFAASNNPSSPLQVSANLVSPDFSWNPGCKTLVGYHFQDIGWDAIARWTWGFFSSTTHATSPVTVSGEGLLPLWIPEGAAIIPAPRYAKSSSALKLHLNELDLELASSGSFSDTLFFTLFGGLKALLIDQTYDVSYFDGASFETSSMLQSSAHTKTYCHGVGPRAGWGTRWEFPHGLSLYGDIAAAAVLSQMKTRRIDLALGLIDGALDKVRAHLHEGFWVWRPLLEMKVAFVWETLWGKSGLFSCEAGYEVQQYWEQNMTIRTADSALFSAAFNNRGNLLFQGLSLSATVGY